MAENDKPVEPPQLPQGFPLAGLPDLANNPAVPDKITAIAHMAVDGILQWAFQNIGPLLLQGLGKIPGAAKAAEEHGVNRGDVVFANRPDPDKLIAQHGGRAAQQDGNIPAPQREQAEKAAPPARLSPYPHGDVDLRFLGANVAAGPVHPVRKQTHRQYYFLPEDQGQQQRAQPDTDVINRLTQQIINPAAGHDKKLGGTPG
jgi:hypothetical protein